ncbi:MAG: family 43 glycosylhydrolase [Verrucomicrobiae bacterium]|nr:family 43 glycosylhydrolase [Verrucomicrobiae bacterium]MCP5544858.1 family 43 glycosylhydrolase [Akkermansiaceae bacterium]MCP5547179.1 family 43 glycosylhydrolase [Akkermansiaceae bacterium]
MKPFRISVLTTIASALASNAATLDKEAPREADGQASWPRVILRGDYPDPSILRDGGDFYMTHSPFLYSPGFLIWHSKDLMNWTPVCRAMTKVVGSAMAPDLVKHDGRYYIYFPAAEKNWVIWSDDIRGPWSDPVRLEVGYIDPGHAVDEDGRRWLFLSAGKRIRLADDGLSVAGKVEHVYDGWDYPEEWETEGKYLESPKLLRRDGWYHKISAEGGTAGPATSHMAISARSKSIDGPWENSPHNPIVHTWSADERWWSKGHGTLVDDVAGNWWIVYHAYEKDRYPLGRQTLIDPVTWTEDGWPVVSGSAPEIPAASQSMVLADDFSGPNLGPQWTTWRDSEPREIAIENGSLFLTAKGSGPADSRLLLVTATDHSYEVATGIQLSEGSTGGLVLFYNEKAFAGIGSDGSEFTIFHGAEQRTRAPNPFGDRFFLKIENHRNRVDLKASGDGKTWITLLEGLDVSEMHHNRFKGFFALRPGLMACGKGEVEFTRFDYRGVQ